MISLLRDVTVLCKYENEPRLEIKPSRTTHIMKPAIAPNPSGKFGDENNGWRAIIRLCMRSYIGLTGPEWIR
jgi:hypothetical protein